VTKKSGPGFILPWKQTQGETFLEWGSNSSSSSCPSPCTCILHTPN